MQPLQSSGPQALCSRTVEMDDSDDPGSGDHSNLSQDEIDYDDDDGIEEARPSETRMIREMGENARRLESSRPGPIRHEARPTPAAPIQKVSNLNNMQFSKPIPVSQVVSNKKQKRVERAMIEPEEIEVSPLSGALYFL